jgi:thymidine kinase
MAELVYFWGTMDCGKSTLAVQVDYNHTSRGRSGLVFTRDDRAGVATLSTRLGLRRRAVEVTAELDFEFHVGAVRAAGRRVDYLICDEAQFYTPAQVDQLARVVDDQGVDVFAFGILSDFRTRLFPGSQRLVELADRMEVLQVEALCWCGAKATHNARTLAGVMVTEGEQMLVGDVPRAVGPDQERADDGAGTDRVSYEVLCRSHHRRGLTVAAAARAGA